MPQTDKVAQPHDPTSVRKLTDGGPAFPTHPFEQRDAGGEVVHTHLGDYGMSLRDYFAGQVLVGLCARDAFDPGQATPQQRARIAYVDADAMLTEREKEQP